MKSTQAIIGSLVKGSGAAPLVSVAAVSAADLAVRGLAGFAPAPGSSRWLWHVIALGLLATLPFAAEVASRRPARSLDEACPALPGGAIRAGLTRVAAVVMVGAWATVLLGVIDCLMAAAFPVRRPSFIGEQMVVPGAGLHLAAVAWTGVVATMLLGIVLRHGVAAILLGVSAAFVPAALDGVRDHSSRDAWLQQFGTMQREHPGVASALLGLVLASAILCGSHAVRGRANRSVLRRAARAFLLPAICASAATLSIHVPEILWRLIPVNRTWVDPTAHVSGLTESPSGRWVAITLAHKGAGERRESHWILDVRDGSVRRIDDGISYFEWVLHGTDYNPSWGYIDDLLLVGRGLHPETLEEVGDVHSLSGSWDVIERKPGAAGFCVRTVQGFGGPPVTYEGRSGSRHLRHAPWRHLYQAPDGWLHRFDLRTGEDTATAASWRERRFSQTASDDGRHVAFRDDSGWDVVDLETGTAYRIDAKRFRWSSGPEVAIVWSDADEVWYDLVGDRNPDGRPFPEKVSGELVEGRRVARANGGRVLIYSSDGSIWKELRGARP